MRRAARTSTCAAVLAIAGVAPAAAGAAPGTVTDSDFAGGTAAATEVVAGAVQLPLGGTRYDFDGNALPDGWDWDEWVPGGSATVAGGKLTVSGARAFEAAAAGAGQVLEFNGQFGADQFQNAGFGVDFSAGPWAMFSTGGDGPATGLWARTRLDSMTASTDVSAPATIPATAPHTYRIEWAAATVRFYIDGQPVAPPHAVTVATPMRPLVSDFGLDGSDVTVDWLQLGSYGAGTFTSRVLDAGDTRAGWGTLTATGDASQAAFETRTGNSATPDTSWSPFTPVGAGGAVSSPRGRYIQYQARLEAADPTVSPALAQVQIGFDVDDVGPTTVIDGIDVTGGTASVRFSSPDADVAGFACGLDGGAVTTCTSPRAFGGLAPGAHSVAVVAVDRLGNTGSPVSRAFTIAAPPAPPAPPRAGLALRLYHRWIRASRTGLVKLRVGCTSGEQTCTVKVRLKRGRRVIGRTTVQMPVGDSRVATLRLPKGLRRTLAERRKVKLTATISARDLGGDKKTLTRTVTITRRR